MVHVQPESEAAALLRSQQPNHLPDAGEKVELPGQDEREAAEICEEIAMKHQQVEGTYAAGKKAGAMECAEAIKAAASPLHRRLGPMPGAWRLAIGEQMERACKDLPYGWSVVIDLELGAGSVYLYDPDGEQVLITTDGDHSFAEVIDINIDAAIARAAQPTPAGEGG